MIRIAEEVTTTKKPRELLRDSKPLAVLIPVLAKANPRKQREKTKADYETFLHTTKRTTTSKVLKKHKHIAGKLERASKAEGKLHEMRRDKDSTILFSVRHQ